MRLPTHTEEFVFDSPKPSAGLVGHPLRRLVGPLNLKPRLQLGAAALRPALFRSPAAIDGRMNCVPKRARRAFLLESDASCGQHGAVEGLDELGGNSGRVTFECCLSLRLHRCNA